MCVHERPLVAAGARHTLFHIPMERRVGFFWITEAWRGFGAARTQASG